VEGMGKLPHYKIISTTKYDNLYGYNFTGEVILGKKLIKVNQVVIK